MPLLKAKASELFSKKLNQERLSATDVLLEPKSDRVVERCGKLMQTRQIIMQRLGHLDIHHFAKSLLTSPHFA